jgi:hypothetical protein
MTAPPTTGSSALKPVVSRRVQCPIFLDRGLHNRRCRHDAAAACEANRRWGSAMGDQTFGAVDATYQNSFAVRAGYLPSNRRRARPVASPARRGDRGAAHPRGRQRRHRTGCGPHRSRPDRADVGDADARAGGRHHAAQRIPAHHGDPAAAERAGLDPQAGTPVRRRPRRAEGALPDVGAVRVHDDDERWRGAVPPRGLQRGAAWGARGVVHLPRRGGEHQRAQRSARRLAVSQGHPPPQAA